MSVIPVTMYQVKCDYPGCEKCDVTDEYEAWATPQQAHEVATTDGGWLSPSSEPAGRHYCPDHVAWCEECDEQMPMTEMVQDPEDKSWTCLSHQTEEVNNGV
jgi:hypothetical protein